MKHHDSPDLKIAIIVQARLGSTRLPGKILKEVLGKTLLEYQIERLKKVILNNTLVIATTVNPLDDPIVKLCNKNRVLVTRGSEEDVLHRYLQAAQEVDADVVLRLTSDCPIIDPKIIDHCLKFYLKHFPSYDYVSNTIERSFPRGMDVEIFSFDTLKKTEQLAKEPSEREHVTKYMYNHREIFKLGSLKSNVDQSIYRLTVDTQEDFILIQKIIEALYPKNPNFNLNDVMDLLKKKPDWVAINAHIKQKQ